MTKTTLAIAAALLAGTTLTSAANAGGVRLGFGFPLGSFVAHQNQSYTPSSGYEKHCAKPARVARHHEEAAPVRHVKRAAPKQEVAEAPAPRKIKRAPKVEVAEAAPAPRIAKVKPVEVQEARLEDKTVANDATPSIYVPETPVADVKGTQSTPVEVTTASIEPAPVATEAKIETPAVEKTVTIEKDEPKAKIAVSGEVKRLCRRFSAAIAGLIDVPCE